MAQQPQGRFRRFLPTPLGRVFLIVLAGFLVFGAYAVNVLFAVPAMLVFGLAVPIWGGLKRPRFLAVLGLVVILSVAPCATVVLTQLVFSPVGTADSGVGFPFSNGTAVMQNASLAPYSGTTDTNFTWNVTIYPQNVPRGNSSPVWIVLYISTCPGATGNSSQVCASGYPLTILNDTLPANQSAPYLWTFHYRVGSDGIWAWQMGIFTKNLTTGRPFFQLLVGDPSYNGIEGPIIGSFSVIYLDLLPSVYVQAFLFLGIPFYFVLLVYMLFKNRERRKKEAQQRALGPVPPMGTKSTAPPPSKGTPLPSSQPPPGPAAAPSAPATATVAEFNCPKCNAVLYAGEKSCWKCGAPISPSP